jgi:hypothetical protein
MKSTFIATMLMAALTFAIISAVSMTNTAMAKTVTGNGYTLEAPNGWKVTNKENRFTSTDKTLDYDKAGKVGSVKLEHSDSFGVDSNYNTDQLEEVIGNVYPDASVFESGDTKYMVNNETVPYVIATMTKENLFGYKHHFVIFAATVPLGDDEGLIVQYIATEDDFDKLNSQVEKIIQSIKPTGSVSSVSLDSADQEKLTGYGGGILPQAGAN